MRVLKTAAFTGDLTSSLDCPVGISPGPALLPATLNCGPLNPPCLGPLTTGPLHVWFLLLHSSDSTPHYQTPHKRFRLLFAGAWPLGGTCPHRPPTFTQTLFQQCIWLRGIPGHCHQPAAARRQGPRRSLQTPCDQSWWRAGSFSGHLFVIPQLLMMRVGHCPPGPEVLGERPPGKERLTG